MGLFGNKKSTKKLANDQWLALEDLAELDKLQSRSKEHPVAIFKHSTRCSISHFAHRQLAQDWPFSQQECPFYYLDLIRYRSLSNEIAQRTGVKHESPQLIILYRDQVLYHDSHERIHLDAIRSALGEISN